MKLFTLIFSILFSITFYAQNEGNITIKSSSAIKKLVNKRIEHNKAQTKIKGYRIQIYYGSENGAIATRNKFLGIFPNISCYIEYETPDWKVKVGNYRTRLEADKAREEILLAFDGAFVLLAEIPKI